MEYIIDVLFLIDLILMFFMTYIDKKGKVVSDSKMIAINYISSWGFLFDLLSVLGSELNPL